ncbi:MAG TPA: hypothetical protein VHC90_04475 [Bryobacteraceae bacterium]|nr:hypothetical protein [Bryobacteraceae bacterium]
MTSTSNTTNEPRHASHRQAICDYLADLPLLDRRVLFHVYAKKEGVRKIATDLRITSTHVEHIVRRTEDFRRNLTNRRHRAMAA